MRLQRWDMQCNFFPSLNSLYSILHRFSFFTRNLFLNIILSTCNSLSPYPFSSPLSVQRSEHYRYLHSTWCTIVCIINSKHICIFRAAYIHGKTIINIARLIRFSSGLAGTILISAIVIILLSFLFSFFLSFQ